ncbi:hypothetical protein FQZ97_1192110 [compost metagenome]
MGKIPPLSERRLRPTCWPSTGVPKMTKYVPTTRKMTRATTLIKVNQNSISPKTLTETRFRARTTRRAVRAQAHCGTSAIQGM